MLFKAIIIYSIPVLLMGLVQKLFNAVDVMVLSFVADTRSVAAVGSSSSIVHLLVDTFFGISIGTRVVLARLIGEGDKKKVSRATSTSLYTAVILGTITAIVGIILTPQFLTWTECPTGPDGCFDQAAIYIRWYLAAAPFMLLYNYGSAILSDTIVSAARIAKNRGSKVLAVTSYPESTLGQLADGYLLVKGRTKKEVDDENYMKRQIHGNYTSLTPLGTAFELTTLVFLDAIVSELMEKMEQTESDLKARHTVLE